MFEKFKKAIGLLDFLAIDEDIVDKRLKSVYQRKKLSSSELENVLTLLLYKKFLFDQECSGGGDFDQNIKEQESIDITESYDFLATLLNNISPDNVDVTCEIIKTVCTLSNSINFKCEHFAQQIVPSIENLLDDKDEKIDNTDAIILQLKVCEYIYGVIANIPRHYTFSNKFLMNPQVSFHSICEKLFATEKNEKVCSHFLINTLKSIIKTENGYKIIDFIWNELIKLNKVNCASVLKILCDMSEHLLFSGSKYYKSLILESSLFWETIVFGLTSSDKMSYKMAIYLAKRSVDNRKEPLFIRNENKDVLIHYEQSLSSKWMDFFVLLESLEESQSNIVLPSLQLFNSVREINCTLTNTVYYIGLHHENYEVRTKCIHYILDAHLHDVNSNEQNTSNKLNKTSLKWIMEVLNDINRFDQSKESHKLMQKFYIVFVIDTDLFFLSYSLIPEIEWSPIPLYHIMFILCHLMEPLNRKNKKLPVCFNAEMIFKATCDIIQMKCNDVIIRKYKCKKINNILNESKIYRYFTWQQKIMIVDLINKSMGDPLRYCWIFEDESEHIDTILEDIMTAKNFRLCFDFCEKFEYQDKNNILLKERLTNMADKLKSLCDQQQYDNNTEDLIHEFVFVSNLFVFQLTNARELVFPHNKIIYSINIILRYLRRKLVKKKLTAVEIELLNNKSMLLTDSNCLKCSKTILRITYDVRELFNEVFNIARTLLPTEQCNEKKIFILNTIKLTLHLELFSFALTDLGKDIFEDLEINNFIKLILNSCIDKETSKGKIRNKFYEISCEIVCILIENDNIAYDIGTAMDYIEYIIDKGGYSCLQNMLKLLHIILPKTINNEDYNFKDILKRIWIDIQELKQSSLFVPAINSFIDLITDEDLLKSKYKKEAVKYFEEIIEFGLVSVRPLHHLSKCTEVIINTANDCDDEILISVIVDMMLFSSPPKKEQRIMRNLVNFNSRICFIPPIKPDYELKDLNDKDFNEDRDCYDVEIQSVVRRYINKMPNGIVLTREFYKTVNKCIMEKVDMFIKNKKRYHFNSNLHRLLVAAVKSLLLVKIKCDNVDNDREVAVWCMSLLNKVPHQNSVKVALEWRIALYATSLVVDKEVLGSLDFWSLPVLSQLNILYLLTQSGNYMEFVLDILLSHTMGSNFNIRLLSQYLSYRIFQDATNLEKYEPIMKIIKYTLDRSVTEKHYIKLNNDFKQWFHLNYPKNYIFIEYLLPRFYDGFNGELFNLSDISNYIGIPSTGNTIDTSIADILYSYNSHENKPINNNVFDCLSNVNASNIQDFLLENEMKDENKHDIQKKYMPWNSMTGIDAIDHNIKNTNHGDLILVASLIDKLPNLGGMARTSEVFGIKTYVVANKAVMEDKQFRGLSVSAEQWIDIEQVAPGLELVEYLRLKKSEGYTLVAAEQTRNSVMLDAYNFPKKSLLLLGHEKTGVPYDILPLMDVCVEIPQQGVVRSLNVHVTASIFVWEYTRQHLVNKY